MSPRKLVGKLEQLIVKRDYPAMKSSNVLSD